MSYNKAPCQLVNDAVGEFLDEEIAARKADPSLRPIYTYPMNGLRKLTDKPLTRPQQGEKASH